MKNRKEGKMQNKYQSNKILNLIAAVNVVAAVVIGAILSNMLIDNIQIKEITSRYFVISGAVSILLTLTSFMSRTRKNKETVRKMEEKYKDNEDVITIVTGREGDDDHEKLGKNKTTFIIVVVIVVQLVAGMFTYISSKNLQNTIISERVEYIKELEEKLNESGDGNYVVSVIDEKTYNTMQIVKRISNWQESLSVRFNFDEENKVSLYPATIDGRYAVKDVDMAMIIATMNTFMEEINKAVTGNYDIYDGLKFNPTNTQLSLLEEQLEKGVDNSKNIVYSQEPINYNGEELTTRFNYNIYKEENSIFEGSEELHISYNLGAGI